MTILPLAVGAEPQAAPTEAEIKQWIEQLDSDKFLVRENATQKLTEAQANAIPILSDSIQSGSLEKAFRCIHVLRNFAVGEDIEMEKEAMAKLALIAATENDRVATYAEDVLKRIAPIKQEQAIRILSGLGVRFSSYNSTQSGFQTKILSGPGITIDASYEGTVDDLYYLRHLQFIEDVQVCNDNVTAAWFAQIAKMPNVRLMTIKDGPVNVAMLRELEPLLPKLAALRLYHINVDGAIAPLMAKLENASHVEFYGLPLTEADQRRIRQVLPPLPDEDLKFRRGGFLGVSGSSLGNTGSCYIENVHQESGAYKGGLKAGDVVIETVGTRVESFQHLIDLLKDKKVGDAIDLTIMRGGRTMKLNVVLGKWPLRPEYGP
ncbi:PDZ domain-containing protein [Blastopirellula marina]|uniref:PDZ domain-containing protein n=1 Tax=Blastopirellula marina TaxID=124 RepID=A0A2S8F777_9BACT|nr:hypothetical protein C5Y98_27275 [Blastopirellula marina]PTL41534.1 PDZ domain-containing protein [Blastopirellula marina]